MRKNKGLGLAPANLFQDRKKEMGQLLEKHWNELYVYIFTILQNKQDAEDVLSAICEKVYGKDDGWEQVEKMKPYLFKMARNMCLDRRREKVRQGTVATGDAAMGWLEGLPDGTDASPDYRMIYAEITSELWKHVDSLPEKYRTVFVRHCLMEESFVSIARELDLTPQTVSTRYDKAIKHLKTKMPYGWPPAMILVLLLMQLSPELKF